MAEIAEPILGAGRHGQRSAGGGSGGKLRGFVRKYCLDVAIVGGEAGAVRSEPRGAGFPRAISAFEMLYLPYVMKQLLDRMCAVQVYPMFVTAQLHSPQKYIGYISLWNDSFFLFLQSTSYKDWLARRVPFQCAMWLNPLLAMVFYAGMACSPAGAWGAVAIAACSSVSAFSPDGYFQVFRRKWCHKADDAAGSSLQVASRYLSSALGLQFGLLIASLASGQYGHYRATYVCAALASFLLCLWSRWAVRVTQLDAAAPEPQADAPGKWAVVRHNYAVALRIFMFSLFTDMTRSTWPRTLTYKAMATAGTSASFAASLNSGSHLISMLGVVIAPRLVDHGRLLGVKVGSGGIRIASVLSFAALSAAHALLWRSRHGWEYFVGSGVMFGLGEALSCGLRENVRMSARRQMEASGNSSAYIKMFDNAMAFLEKIVTMGIGFAIPYFGDKDVLGMDTISLILSGFAFLGALWSMSLGETIQLRREAAEIEERRSVQLVHCPCLG